MSDAGPGIGHVPDPPSLLFLVFQFKSQCSISAPGRRHIAVSYCETLFLETSFKETSFREHHEEPQSRGASGWETPCRETSFRETP